jgi:hypothetical protein
MVKDWRSIVARRCSALLALFDHVAWAVFRYNAVSVFGNVNSNVI